MQRKDKRGMVRSVRKNDNSLSFFSGANHKAPRKAVILAAGKGSRLAWGIPKPLIKLKNHPLIYYPIKNFYDAGIRKFIIVAQSRTIPIKDELLKYFSNIEIEICCQKKPEGTARALFSAEKLINPDEYFYLTYCDNIALFKLKEIEEMFLSNDYGGALIITDNPSNPRTSVAVVRGNMIKQIHEKPLKTAGRKIFPVYILGGYIFKYLRNVKKSSDGEYNLSDAINIAIAGGKRFGYVVDNNRRINLNTADDFKRAVKLLSSQDLSE